MARTGRERKTCERFGSCGWRWWGWGRAAARWPACWPTAATRCACSSGRRTRARWVPGMWLQEMGQQVLDRLGVLSRCARSPRSVPRRHPHRGGTSAAGPVLRRRARRGARARGAPGSAVHPPARAGATAWRPGRPGGRGARRPPEGRADGLQTAGAAATGFDLVVGADGTRSAVRRQMALTVRDHPYAYGALWGVVDDPDRLAGHRLFQSLRGTREYLGVLPTGRDQASVFWSVRHRDVAEVLAGGLSAWRDAARPLAGPTAPLLDRVEALLPAAYRDVVVRSPLAAGRPDLRRGPGGRRGARDEPPAGGRDLARAGRRLESRPGPGRAARPGPGPRRVRRAAGGARALVPVVDPADDAGLPELLDAAGLAPGRPGAVGDAAAGHAAQLVTTLCGDRTSPWGRWHLPG